MVMDSNETVPKVLIVEDEVDLADLFANWVGETNTVEVAYDFETAASKIDDSFDVALLDRQLPDGSGDDILEIIRERQYDCRVAMVTATDLNPGIVEKDFDKYISKPVAGDDLRDAVDGLLHRGHLRQEEVQHHLAA